MLGQLLFVVSGLAVVLSLQSSTTAVANQVVNEPDTAVSERDAVDLVRSHRHLPRGAIVTELPSPYEVVVTDDLRYYFAAGTFYLPDPAGFVVVAPPPGTAVTALPEESESIRIQGVAFFSANGVFYRDGPAGTFVVTDAPVGARIANLAAGAIATYSGEALQFEYGGVYYEPRMTRDGIAYEVVSGRHPRTVHEGAGSLACGPLGIEGRFLDASTIFELTGLDCGGGVLIEAVAPGSPAERAGLAGGSVPVQVGDEVVLLGGDLLVAVELPGLCQGECLIDAPRLLAVRRLQAFGLRFLRGGQVLRTIARCSADGEGE